VSSGVSLTSRAATPVDDLAPGMVLGESVHDGQGRLLMSAGTELTERHVRAFRLWGIMSVRVRGADGEEEALPDISPEAMAAARERILPRFARNDLQHPLIAVLLDECARRDARRMATGSHA